MKRFIKATAVGLLALSGAWYINVANAAEGAYLILQKAGQHPYIVAEFKGPRSYYNCGWIAKAVNSENWGGQYFCSAHIPWNAQNRRNYE